MRIVISYFFDETYIPVGYSLAEGFQQLGHEVACFDSTLEHPFWRYLLKPLSSAKRRLHADNSFEIHSRYGHQGYKRFRFFQLLDAFRPEVVLILKAHDFLRPEDVELAKAKFGVQFVIGWSVDGPNVSFDHDHACLMYDRYYSIHKHNCHNPAIHRLSLCAVDRKRYVHTQNAFAQRQRHAVLISGWNPRRQAWLPALLQENVEIYGRWSHHNAHTPGIKHLVHDQGAWGDSLQGIYNETRLGLNIQGWDPETDPCCNLRVMDIPACGTLLLTEYSQELESYYQLGTEADSFTCPEEMADKIAFYRKNPSSAERMAAAGYQRNQRLPDYQAKAREVLQGVGL